MLKEVASIAFTLYKQPHIGTNLEYFDATQKLWKNLTCHKTFYIAAKQVIQKVYTLKASLTHILKEYNIVSAPNLKLLATQVAGLILMSWKLKGGMLEHKQGFAQQLVRSPGDTVKLQTTSAATKYGFK